MMQRSQEQLSRVFSPGLLDELWEVRGRSWQRRGLIRSALVMSAFESVQCFMEEINSGHVDGFGVWSGVGAVCGVLVWRMRGMRVDEGSIELFDKRDVLWLLLCGDGTNIVQGRWRELNSSAIRELALQEIVRDATGNMTQTERELMWRMQEDFHGTFGELVDAVHALS
jgi:hypothetical protein